MPTYQSVEWRIFTIDGEAPFHLGEILYKESFIQIKST